MAVSRTFSHELLLITAANIEVTRSRPKLPVSVEFTTESNSANSSYQSINIKRDIIWAITLQHKHTQDGRDGAVSMHLI